jgi:bleomycin hydrolase
MQSEKRPDRTATPGARLTETDLARFAKEFDANPQNKLMQNAVSKTPIEDIALDRDVVTSIDHTVSHLLTDRKVTNQEKSGRCWLFAGLNLLRTGAAAKLGVKDFEFSQNYALFWDKMEKANYFLEAIITTADRDADDRSVAHLLSEPISDGGQWNMFIALVRKHGLVPKAAMPETHSSSNTRGLNHALTSLLRKGSRDLRTAAADGASPDRLQELKGDLLEAAHRMLVIHLGTQPTEFLWQWTAEDKTFHRQGTMTPLEFAAEYVTIPLDDYVCLVHDPRETSEPGKTYTVEFLGNIVGAPPVIYLNVEMSTLRELAMKTIVDGEPVWFGCDTGKMSNTKLGMWDAALYDYNGVYGTDLTLSKAERLVFHDSLMTHAMLFVGVDVVDGAPRKWRVENSWGDESADKGLWTMNDNWFGEHVFEIAVRRELLPPELQSALETEPVMLPAWDPMGALAR